VWRFEYSAAFLVIILIVVLLIYGLISKSAQYSTEAVLSINSKFTLAFAATPWVLFVLPPNKSALFDSVLWFGGSWHLVGALIVSNAVISTLRPELRGYQFYFWIFLSSFWSEVTASVMFVILMLNFKSDKRIARAITMPATSLILNLMINLSNNRIGTVHQDKYRDNLSILKGSIKMIVEYGLSAFFVALVLSTIILPFTKEAQEIPRKKISLIIIFTTLMMISIYLVGYPTWRSTSIIGVLFLTLQLPLFLKRSTKTYSILVSIIVTILLGFINITALNSINTVAVERSSWWERVVSTKDPISTFDFSGNSPDFLQADYGSSEWINQCFNKLTIKKVV
jgi:hypothetical protein